MSLHISLLITLLVSLALLHFCHLTESLAADDASSRKQISTRLDTPDVIVGGEAKLTCNVTIDGFSVYWSRGKKPFETTLSENEIPYDQDKYSIIYKEHKEYNDSKIRSYTLLIPDVKLDDTDNYECRIGNKVSSVRVDAALLARIASLTATVDSRPVVVGGEVENPIDLTGNWLSAVFTCESECGRPMPNLTMKFAGVRVRINGFSVGQAAGGGEWSRCDTGDTFAAKLSSTLTNCTGFDGLASVECVGDTGDYRVLYVRCPALIRSFPSLSTEIVAASIGAILFLLVCLLAFFFAVRKRMSGQRQVS